jgi:hypothetical protein
MRYGMRHLIGAILLLSALSAGRPGTTAAQECLDCQNAPSADDYDDGLIADGSGPGNYNCFRPNDRRGKACYAYRPFTEASQPDVFYNYYVPNNMGAAAAAYPAPYPTPSLIGHTYYTYQPLMPHEFLYTHHRTYHQYYNGGMGLNRTSVHWHRTPVRTAIKDIGGSVGWFLGNLHR